MRRRDEPTFAIVRVLFDATLRRWYAKCSECGRLPGNAHRSAWAGNLADHHQSLHALGRVGS